MKNVRFFHFLNKVQPADVNIYSHLKLYSMEGYEQIAIIGWKYLTNPLIERLEIQFSIRIFFQRCSEREPRLATLTLGI